MLVLSGLELNLHTNDVCPRTPQPEESYIQYIKVHRYKKALEFGTCFELDLCLVFSGMAEKCVRMYKS